MTKEEIFNLLIELVSYVVNKEKSVSLDNPVVYADWSAKKDILLNAVPRLNKEDTNWLDMEYKAWCDKNVVIPDYLKEIIAKGVIQ